IRVRERSFRRVAVRGAGSRTLAALAIFSDLQLNMSVNLHVRKRKRDRERERQRGIEKEREQQDSDILSVVVPGPRMNAAALPPLHRWWCWREYRRPLSATSSAS